MTNNQLTEEVLQGIYTVAVSGEIAEKNEEPMSAFDLLCAADAAGGIARLVRKLIDELRADRAELQERLQAEQDSEPVAWSNGCDKTAPSALRYLAENERPSGGSSTFNTEHLYQLAREIELMAGAPLYRHAQPAPVVNENLYKLANHIASSKNGLPDEWQDWADELETDIRRAAMLQAGDAVRDLSTPVDPQVAEYEQSVMQAGNSPVIPDTWIPVSERMPDPKSDQRVCAYTPTPHEDIRYRFVPASLFKAVCTDATHWHYMEPPAAPQEDE